MLSKFKWKQFLRPCLAVVLGSVLFLTSCSNGQERGLSSEPFSTITRSSQRTGTIKEVAPPEILQTLNQALDRYQPQVKILSPRSGEILESDQVSVKLQAKDIPLFKDARLSLGSHLDVVLDNRPSQAVYDLSEPLVFRNLEPGTHTLRVFASRPWHESFKNEGAFAQVTFSLFTTTDQNNPNANIPLLTYNAPADTLGAEPILLDFYLSNAPLRLGSEAGSPSGQQSWRIRCTINGQSFVLDRWQPLYLTGFKSGKNWVRLELIDGQGQTIQNVFNDVVQVIDYQPGGNDTLSQLMRGDLKLARAKALITPGYKEEALEPTVAGSKPTDSKQSVPEPTPSVTPTPQGTPSGTTSGATRELKRVRSAAPPATAPTEFKPKTLTPAVASPSPTLTPGSKPTVSTEPTAAPEAKEATEPQSVKSDTASLDQEPEKTTQPVWKAFMQRFRTDANEISTPETSDAKPLEEKGVAVEETGSPSTSNAAAPSAASEPETEVKKSAETQPQGAPVEPSSADTQAESGFAWRNRGGWNQFFKQLPGQPPAIAKDQPEASTPIPSLEANPTTVVGESEARPTPGADSAAKSVPSETLSPASPEAGESPNRKVVRRRRSMAPSPIQASDSANSTEALPNTPE